MEKLARKTSSVLITEWSIDGQPRSISSPNLLANTKKTLATASSAVGEEILSITRQEDGATEKQKQSDAIQLDQPANLKVGTIKPAASFSNQALFEKPLTGAGSGHTPAKQELRQEKKSPGCCCIVS